MFPYTPVRSEEYTQTALKTSPNPGTHTLFHQSVRETIHRERDLNKDDFSRVGSDEVWVGCDPYLIWGYVDAQTCKTSLLGLGLFALCIVWTNSRICRLVYAGKGQETFTNHDRICSEGRAGILWVGVEGLRVWIPSKWQWSPRSQGLGDPSLASLHLWQPEGTAVFSPLIRDLLSKLLQAPLCFVKRKASCLKTIMLPCKWGSPSICI